MPSGRPSRNRPLEWHALGLGAFAVALLLFATLEHQYRLSPVRWPMAVSFAITCVAIYQFAFIGVRCISVARQSSFPDYERIRRRDKRQPILLLRSFKDDNLAMPDDEMPYWLMRGHRRTLEEVIVKALRRFGPMFALGNPDEDERPFGCVRPYLPHDQWIPHVAEMIAESAAIVMILGSTRSLGAELESLIEAGLAQRKLILVVPPYPRDEVERRWRVFGELWLGAAEGWGPLPSDWCIVVPRSNRWLLRGRVFAWPPGWHGYSYGLRDAFKDIAAETTA